ncbi:AAA family ATPase [Chloroflexi bacterium TSY]|nr:AAA family ATPase [Chloroflexi bacterium TSY]
MPDAKRLYELTRLREEKGLTLTDMAKYCGLKGIRGRESVGLWEQGISVPQERRQPKFLEYLHFGLELGQTDLKRVWNILEGEWGWAPLDNAELQRPSADLSPLKEGNAFLSPVPPLLTSSTPLFGRVAEMDLLRQVWQDVRAGSGQFVLISGEPGTGKSRLVEELLQTINDDAITLRVKCPEMQHPLAYTLFVELLRNIFAQPGMASVGDTWLVEVNRLLPELRDQYPDLPRPLQLDPGVERRRLFDAICTTLASLSASKPLVLFLDDLQWADATSLALLTYLSQWVSKSPVLILGTCRLQEVDATHPIHEVQLSWQGMGLLKTIALDALTYSGVVDL